jgi:tetrahydromethanopterin S-methyltransferase subunit G
MSEETPTKTVPEAQYLEVVKKLEEKNKRVSELEQLAMKSEIAVRMLARLVPV